LIISVIIEQNTLVKLVGEKEVELKKIKFDSRMGAKIPGPTCEPLGNCIL